LIPASGAIGADVVGVVGLGIMGGAIARHLTAAGVTVGGHDPDAFACASAEAAGVAIASTFEELALRSRVLISSLPSASAAIDLAARLAATDVSRRTLIEMSTLALEDKLSVAEILRPSGHDLIDCPISGTGAQMAVKDVALYASGPNSVVKRCTPLLALFSREQFNLGAFGAGTRMKLIANLLVAIHNVAAAEAMGLGEAAGLDRSDPCWRGQFAYLRTSRADDGRSPICSGDDEAVRLGERHECDHGLRRGTRSPHAAVRCGRADLRCGPRPRPR
jgi:3-hydroxyisobutyrate dehydrogenase-like beta-hydroxyacid dehydrogenase